MSNPLWVFSSPHPAKSLEGADIRFVPGHVRPGATNAMKAAAMQEILG